MDCARHIYNQSISQRRKESGNPVVVGTQLSKLQMANVKHFGTETLYLYYTGWVIPKGSKLAKVFRLD